MHVYGVGFEYSKIQASSQDVSEGVICGLDAFLSVPLNFVFLF